MLDSSTKSRIDSARDILVGKVPDPKSQVEQITIALIYKFMDDMDRQSEELGGKASFFKGEFKKYRWADLLDKRLSGHERLELYRVGIERMNENKNIPQLFRDIFRGVFLPYRDPETLNLFLKEINNFTYGHSEELGNAYEYLLSVLGTQGDAGQFRTPRHIIDFIVSVVDPHKEDTVLDPACGTAGFLISAYKHILAAHNSSHPSSQSNSRPLTPDDRARLMTNFCGYDIAPDMVRLSRVNLYLHGFQNPVIHEYDTLTSEERWDERYDVIMANPPFMSPKGGIRPHNRFSIQANRSEVLFVDYIAEHLNPGGRAGVIVPEGIIFQSQNAYKALRKMLVENYLWAVVSLPAGVFNPYAGVKTSILFLDRNLVKRADSVLFVKIENDGFDLGAQRREVEGSELPEALKAIEAWKQNQKAPKEGIALAVARKRLLESADCNLSGDRYRPITVRGSGKWPTAKLGEVCDVNPSKSELNNSDDALEVSFVPMSAMGENQPSFEAVEKKSLREVIKGYTYFRDGDVLFAKITPCFENGKAGIARGLNNGVGFGSTEFIVLRPEKKRLLPELLYYFIASDRFRSRGVVHMTGSAGQQRVPASFVQSYEIPLPPLPEQERLVAELESYRRLIEAARQIVASYKPSIRIDPAWEILPMGEVCDVRDGTHESPRYHLEGYPLITSKNIKDGRINFDDVDLISKEDLERANKRSRVDDGDILMPMIGTIGNPIVVRKDREFAVKNVALIKFPNNSQIDPKYLKAILESDIFRSHLLDQSQGSTQKFVSLRFLRALPIPVPPLPEQRSIVAEIEAERSLVDSNRELIARFEKKMQARLAEIWGDEDH